MKNIAIVMGGYSAEKVISMKSGQVVFDNLDRNKYIPFKVIIDENSWKLNFDEIDYPISKNDFTATINGELISFDAVFIAVHGSPGEDGILQKYFDNLNIPYTSSGAQQSKLSFDKYECNKVLAKNGLPCAKSFIINSKENLDIKQTFKKVNLPCFVKPNSNGSSFGVSKVNKYEDFESALQKAFQFDNNVLVESFLDGVEVTCGIHNFNNKLFTFPLTEIISENTFFDYQAKYEGKSQEITPARLSKEVTNKVFRITKEVYKTLDLNGIARIDFIIVGEKPFIIEANTVPGLSLESIIPQQAQSIGINLTDLFSLLLEKALKK